MITRIILAVSLTASLAPPGPAYLQGERVNARLEEIDHEARQLFYKGAFVGARIKFHEAFELSKKLSGQIPTHLAQGIRKMEGLCYQYLDEIDQALTIFQEVLRLNELEGSSVADRADTLNVIGRALYLKGDYEKAIEFLHRADTLIPKDHEHPRSRILFDLGAVYASVGNYFQALRCLKDGMAEIQLENALTPKRQMMEQTQALQQLGSLELSLGSTDKALAALGEAVRLGRGADRKEYNRTYLVDALNELGMIYRRLEDSQNALLTLQEALNLSQSLETRRLIARSILNLGNVERDLGQIQRAVEYHHRALALGEETSHRPTLASALAELGADYSLLRRFQESIGYFERSLDAGGAAVTPELRASIYSGLADSHRGLGDEGKALEYYDQAIDSIEDVKLGALSADRKIGFWQTKQAAFDRAITLLYDLHQKDQTGGFDHQAFAYAEKARARALLDLVAEGRVQIHRGLSQEVKQEENAIQLRISRTRKMLQREDLTKAETASLERQLKTADERLEDFRQRLRLNQPAYAAIQYPQPYDLSRVQREVLDQNTLLLEYLLGDNASYLWAVSKDRCLMIKLPGRRKIELEVKRFRNVIAAPPKDKKSFERFYSQSRRLYALLLKPAELLHEYKTLVIAPDGILHYLPFETLIGGRTGTATNKPPYLLATHTVNTVSSATVLGLLGRQEYLPQDSGVQLLAYADPLFSLHQKSQVDAGRGHARLADIVRGEFHERGVRFLPLPFTRREVKGIASQYPKSETKIYLGSEATEGSLKREDLSQYEFIHFATHAVISEEFPALSGIVLSLATEGEDEDGFLTMNEIFNLNLHADLVVLSACQTGLGKLVRGEGLIGLTQAFMYAGAPSVMVSLWNVRDSSTAELMKNLYKHLRAGESKAEALRKAKLEMIRSGRPAYRFPYFWAPFVLAGRG